MNNSTLNSSFSESMHHGHPVPPTAAEIWGIGLVAVTLINSCAAVGIAIMPLLGRRSFHYLLTWLIGLGVGSLSGSALFHLLPEAFQLHDPDRNFAWKSWTAVAGVYLFFLVDKVLKIVVRLRKRSRQIQTPKSDNSTTISNTSSEKSTKSIPVICPSVNTTTANSKMVDKELALYGENSNIDHSISCKNSSCNNNNDSLAESIDAIVSGEERKATETPPAAKEIAPVAWMIIFGDAIHNFVDGLSIGAAFTESVLSGVSICVAVVCEEFPHEFGDIAILVSSGMTMRQALGYNLLSAMTCYFGFVLGVIVGEMAEATVYIFALAAGMFLYVALANMVPEMNDAMERAMDVSLRKGFIVGALQLFGIAAGLTIMFLLGFYDTSINFG